MPETYTIWVCPPKGSEEGMWSSEVTGPWRTIAEYRGLDDPIPVEVVPISALREVEQELQERDGKIADLEEDCIEGRANEAEQRKDIKGLIEERDHLQGRLSGVAKTLEEWGADNAAKSDQEGDVADERYKAFQISAELVRRALDTALPDTTQATGRASELRKARQAANALLYKLWGCAPGDFAKAIEAHFDSHPGAEAQAEEDDELSFEHWLAQATGEGADR